MPNNAFFLGIIIVHRDGIFEIIQNGKEPLRIVNKNIFAHNKHICVIAITGIIKRFYCCTILWI